MVREQPPEEVLSRREGGLPDRGGLRLHREPPPPSTPRRKEQRSFRHLCFMSVESCSGPPRRVGGKEWSWAPRTLVEDFRSWSGVAQERPGTEGVGYRRDGWEVSVRLRRPNLGVRVYWGLDPVRRYEGPSRLPGVTRQGWAYRWGRGRRVLFPRRCTPFLFPAVGTPLAGGRGSPDGSGSHSPVEEVRGRGVKDLSPSTVVPNLVSTVALCRSSPSAHGYAELCRG